MQQQIKKLRLENQSLQEIITLNQKEKKQQFPLIEKYRKKLYTILIRQKIIDLKLTELQNKNKILYRDIDNQKFQINKLNNENNNYKKQNQKQIQLINQYKLGEQKLIKQIRNLQTQKTILQQANNELQISSKTLSMINNQRNSEIQSKQQQIQNLRVQFSDIKKQLQQQVNKKWKQNSILQKNIQNREKQINELCNQKSNIKMNYERQRKRIVQIEQQLQQQKNKNILLSNSINDLNLKIKNTQDMLLKYKGMNNNKQEQNRRLQEQIEKIEQNNKQNERQLKILRNRLKQRQQQYETIRQEYKQVQQQKKGYQKNNKILVKQINELNKKLQNIQQMSNEMNSEKNYINKMYKQQKKRIQQYNIKILQLQQTIRQYIQQICIDKCQKNNKIQIILSQSINKILLNHKISSITQNNKLYHLKNNYKIINQELDNKYKYQLYINKNIIIKMLNYYSSYNINKSLFMLFQIILKFNKYNFNLIKIILSQIYYKKLISMILKIKKKNINSSINIYLIHYDLIYISILYSKYYYIHQMTQNPADKNKKLQIKFSGQRKVFVNSKKSSTFNQINSPIKITQNQQPILSSIPVEKIKQKTFVKRQKFADEVVMVFNPKKYRIINPIIRFEYRKCKIQIKLNDIFHEEGQILSFFINQNYKNNHHLKRLNQLCQYDIANHITQQKVKNAKVLTLTSKTYQKFQGIFLIYNQEPYNRISISQCLKSLFIQIQNHSVEQISMIFQKNYTDIEELGYLYIDEIINFLSRAKTVPNKIKIIVEQADHFQIMSKIYRQIILKVNDNNNICLHREKLN